ncbi:hypothetical protein NJL88_09855 [Streptomyces sp. DK15]|uniref:hypothetical protein n=1 Tax=Streptomyces sp. DK15 TaxID=2957499 RepID=UPI0029B61620|nr:hypothetical protein [Streptomyces sp. DK15]MDX2390355.1 hypothetical protein [Streptomyces sp. DK15]
MTAYAKHVPSGVIPATGVRTWGVPASESWLKERVPLFFAPGGGSWALAVLVVVSLLPIAWTGAPEGAVGTAWRAYPMTLLLVALPIWFRYLPGAAAVSAALIALESGAALVVRGTGAARTRVGLGLVCLAALWALVGALLRLRARRRQAERALAAAGPARFPVPGPLPDGHGRRGIPAILFGVFLCLAGGAVLLDGLVRDFGTHGEAVPYDAVGRQWTAAPLLVLGSTLLGRGGSADRAARRLRDVGLPAMVVGVRISRSGHHWLYPDADETAGRPLIAFRARGVDTRAEVRMLAGGPTAGTRRALHDVDAHGEPFEAVLYGVPRAGSEVVLEYAVHDGRGSRISSWLTAAVLLPRRRHGLDRWIPAGVSHRESTERMRARAEERRREQARLRTEKEKEKTGRDRRTNETAGGCGGTGCGGDGGCGGCGCG